MLPNLIVIGAPKAGTTSLHYYLDLHPEIRMSQPKELNFFTETHNWARGVAWYESKFTGNAAVHGEASPSYTMEPLHAGVAQRMHSIVPHARLVYIVRDPLSRIVSHYIQRVAACAEDRELGEALLEAGGNDFIDGTRYAMQIEAYLEYYPMSQIKIITTEDLLTRRTETLGSLFRFLEVADTFSDFRFLRMRHRAIRKRRPNRFGLRLREGILQSALYRWSPDMAYYLEAVATLPFSRAVPVPEVSPGLRRELLDRLNDDLEQFKKIADRSFEEWDLD